MTSTPEEDRTVRWLVAAANGDRAAFEALYRHWYPQIVRFCIRMLGDPHRGEEAAQETFVDLYRALGRYRERGSFRAYLFTLAANRCRKELRRRRELPLPEHWDPVGGDDPEAEAVRSETERRLAAAFAALPERQRAALVLVLQEGLSLEEAAQTLGTRVGTVKSWIHRAKCRLGAALVEVEP